MVEVTIRDGRTGRVGGQAGVEPNRDGEVLDILPDGSPLQIGDVIALPDGTKVEVIGIRDDIEPIRPGVLAWRQTAHIGTLFTDSPVTNRVIHPHEVRLINAGDQTFSVAIPVIEDRMPELLKTAISRSRSMKTTGMCEYCKARPVWRVDHFEFYHLLECTGSDEWLTRALLSWTEGRAK